MNRKEKNINLTNIKDDLEDLYFSLTKNKNENEKRAINNTYQTIWTKLEEMFFKKEDNLKIDNNDSSKNKGDNTKNKIALMENSKLLIKDDMSLESIFNIIRYKETTNFINNDENDYDYDDYLNEKEDPEPPVIKAIINEIQQLDKKLYNIMTNNDDKKNLGNEKNEKYSIKKKIELYLFVIYLIIKNYPLFIPKRCYLEQYYLQLKKYKDWPGQIGCQGKILYSLLIDELYLPGITLFKEIREKYLLDPGNPNNFFLISDDFIRYYFLGDYNSHSKYLGLFEKFGIKAKDIFSEFNGYINNNKHSLKADDKSLKEFNCLTIMHLIIFFCQQILSHKEKVQLNVFQRLCQQYFKAIPDRKIEIKEKNGNKENENDDDSFDNKNIRNILNKNLLNSFFNICDAGLKTDYYKDFLPMIKELEKKIISSINDQEGQHNINILNLRKYLKPKIEIKGIKDKENNLYELYQYNYLNIEDKYLSHLNKPFDYSNYIIKNVDKERVDQFNAFVKNKKNILEKFIKLRIILQEDKLIDFINILIEDTKKLYNQLIEKKNPKNKEIEPKEKKQEPEPDKKSKKKRDKLQIEKEKKEREQEKKEEEEREKYIQKLKHLKYYELKKEENYLKNDKNNDKKNDRKNFLENEMNKRLLNVLPEIEQFLNSIILYILPNDNSGHLSDYISRNDFIYQYVFCKKTGNEADNLLKDSLCIYLEEAKNSFELNIYKLILTSENDELTENYFYSFIEVDVVDHTSLKIIVNNQQEPEDEEKYKMTDISKIYIVNLMNFMLNEKNKLDVLAGMAGAKYILNENCGHLTVFCLKNNQNEANYFNNTNSINNMSYYGKILTLQAYSNIFNCDSIKISGKLKVFKGKFNLKNNLGNSNIVNDSNDPIYKELKIDHATYDVLNNEKRIKLKIATFNEFNI